MEGDQLKISKREDWNNNCPYCKRLVQKGHSWTSWAKTTKCTV